MKGRDEVNGKTEEAIGNLCGDLEVLKDFHTYLKARGAIESPKSRQAILRMILQYGKSADCMEFNDWDKLTNPQTLDKFIVSKRSTVVFRKNNKGKIEREEVFRTKSYIRFIYYSLNRFFEFGIDRKFIELNPMKGYDRPKGCDAPTKRQHLTEDDFRKILQAIANGCGTGRAVAQRRNWMERDDLIMKIFMTTGVRESALTEINVEDVDLTKGELRVVDKGNKHHKYDVSELIPCFEAWLDKRSSILEDETTDALFISNRKQRMSANSVAKLVRKYSSDAIGKELSPHDLRAGMVTILIEKGKPLTWVCEAIGHANPATTARYNISDGEEKKEAAAIMASVCGI